VLYNLARFICNLVIMLLFKVEVIGLEDFPKDGPVIVYSNHKSMWDPILIGCVLKRPVFFMAKQELFKNSLFGLLLRGINAFPVKREMADRKAIRKGLEILSEGKVLGIFPEGKRSKTGELLEPEPGIALMAVKSGNTKLVPVAIKGGYKWFSKINVIIGKAMELKTDDGRLSSAQLKDISVKIFKEVAKIMPL
jgi:1-acyl-sn-glycerol-3-phosphate acyltransferase